MSGISDDAVPVKLLSAEADAWSRYATTCRLGGTRSERAWSFDRAMGATTKVLAFRAALRHGHLKPARETVAA